MDRMSITLVLVLAVLVQPSCGDGNLLEAPNTQEGIVSSPGQALRDMTAPEGFSVSLFAAEPDVRQPIALATDSRGRLWVAENYTYGEKPVNFASHLRDRIIILEDANHDGGFDRRKVFWDQASKLTSIEVGFGGVWALCAPYLLFIPDRDGDDRPDGEPVVVLDGWDDDRVRHNIVNGLRWGPDGWLYGRHGILATSNVGRPGDSPDQRQQINCGIWRYHPTRQVFEVVAKGTTNPWGMDWDEHGQMFFINTVIGHLWHVVPGARYERMYGEHFNPYLYELIPQTADHFHWDTAEPWDDIRIRGGSTDSTRQAGGGHAHSGFLIYQGDNWPQRYRGTALTLNFHGRRINRDVLQRSGSGYVARHAPDLLMSSDSWFRGVELISGADGGVYIADWSDIGDCHEDDGVHRTSGRIYKVTYKEPVPSMVRDVATLTDTELVQLQLHENDWYVRQSRRVLQERAARGSEMSGVHRLLKEMYAGQRDVTRRLRALWSLYVSGGLDEAWLLEQLDEPDEHLRVWAVKLLVDQGQRTPAAAAALVQLSERESSGLVLLFLASALQQLPPEQSWAVAMHLSSKSQFAEDPVLPLMIWYGIEPSVGSNPARAIEMVGSTRMGRIRLFLARRMTTELTARPEPVNELLKLALDTGDADARLQILEGMSTALRGWRRAKPPPAWKSVAAALSKSPHSQISQLLRELGAVFGDGLALEELREIATSDNTDLSIRRSAIRSLVSSRADKLVPLLEHMLENPELAPDALRGFSAIDYPSAPGLIVQHYDRLRVQGRVEAISALASRPSYALSLLAAVRDGAIRREDITAFQIRQMHSFGDPKISRQLHALWPELRHTSADQASKINEYQLALTPAQLTKADLGNGRLMFKRACTSCHRLFGDGGRVGPELTGAQRNNLTYLLENIVAPSTQLAEDYRMSIVHLEDGRVLNGVVSQQTGETMVVQTPTQQLVIRRAEVEKIREEELSMMPEQLLDALSFEQVRDLIAYLMSNRQVPLPAGGEIE